MILMFTAAIVKSMKLPTPPPRKNGKFIMVLLAVSISFLNVFAMELMLFPETAFEFSVSNLALGAAVYIPLHKNTNKFRDWLFSWLFLMMALGSYQSYIGIFTAFMFTGILLKFRDNKKMRYTYSALTLLIGAGASAVNVLIVKIMIHRDLIADSGRNASLSPKKIFYNLRQIAKYQISFWKNADNILPDGIMPVILCTLLVLLILSIRQLKYREQKLYLLCIVFGCYLMAFAPHIIEGNILLTPRSNLAVWTVIAMIFIFAIDLCPASNKYAEYFCCLALVFILSSNILIMQDMAANEQMTNAIDIKEAQQIADQIRIYENTTGNIITKIAAANDKKVSMWHKESRYKNRQLGARIMATHYSNYRLIGYVMGRDFKKIDMPDHVYEAYFEENWDHLVLERQLVCMEDTAYIAVY